jgi:outer membrane protein insertion porin family
MKHKLLLAFITFITFLASAGAFEISKVKFVDQDGNDIPYEMFISRIKIKPGMQFSPKMVSDAIKSIYKTKKIKDVVSDVIVVDGEYHLVFKMVLNVLVSEIAYEGNVELDEDDFVEEVKHLSGVPLDMEQLAKDKAKIFELYSKEGHFNTEVDIKTVETEVPGEVKVIFVIKEKKAYQIDSVTIVGASVFDPEDLTDEFKTQPSFWRYLFSTGFLNEEIFNFDIEQLKRKYKARGYLDFRVLDVEKVYDEEYVNLIIYIKEAEPYTIDKISMHWLKIPGKAEEKYIFQEEDLRPLLNATEEFLYNGDTEKKDIDRMKEKYNNLGYLEFSCRTILKTDINSHKVNVEYHIYEGVPSVIRDTKIVGNTITKDYVIRREMALHPTDLSNQLLIDKSKSRLLGLGFFQEVDIIPVDTGIEGEKDLRVKISEKDTGRINFGAGVSSASSFIGSIGFQQSNFDLGAGWPYRGGGQKLRASLEAGTRRSRAEISFVEPWLYDKPLSLRTSIYYRTSIYDEIEEERLGVSADLTSSMKDYPGWKYTRGWRVEQVSVDVESDASQELRDEEVSDLVSALYFNFTKDTRDQIRRPTRGGRIVLATEVQTAFIGSENNSYKLRLSGTEYFSVFEESVIRIKGEIGVTDALDNVPIYDRFFAGGLNSIRGYEFRKVGPVDINEEELGGNSLLLGSIELDVPLFKRVNGAWFIDAGNVWRSSYGWNPFDINVSMGLGIRLDLPIGVLQLDYGVPIYNVNEADSTGRLHFNFGYQF